LLKPEKLPSMSSMDRREIYKIINLSDIGGDWCWLRDDFAHLPNEWTHYSSLNLKVPNWLPKKQSVARFIQAYRAIQLAKKSPSLLVTHGPRPAYYGARMAQILNPALPHLMYSFNFTNLPTGFQHKAMAKAYEQINRFVVYSSLEKKVYADYFGIDPERIDMIHWSVHPPQTSTNEPPLVTGEYICALGSQGRDYHTLFEAMRQLKHIKLIVVATKECIKDLSVPDNVKVYTQIPLSQAHNILTHSKFMVVPLRDSQVPCGHVTIVSGMFFKKAMIVTNSEGVHDYIQDHQTGLFYKPKEVIDLIGKIDSLWSNTVETNGLAKSA
jgi:glycosyltransferase involved in cell wall biosynthesis